MWEIKPEVPTTEDVYTAYRDWYDPEYRNPEYQAQWERVNREEFETWLEGIRAEAWDAAIGAAIDHDRLGVIDEPEEIAGYIDQHWALIGKAKMVNPYRKEQ